MMEEKLQRRFPGILLNFSQPIATRVDELLSGIRAQIAVKIFGDDMKVLEAKANEVTRLISGVRGAADVQAEQVSGMPQLKIELDRAKLARYGVSVPSALVGGIVALFISGQNVSVAASVGFIVLFGVAVLNGVVMVSYINDLRRRGANLHDAVVEGALLRLRPVLMTALVASLGLVPLLFAHGTGSEIQRPLATVVIGGLITSTALTLLVLPTVYRWFEARAPEVEV